jgi:hypothetical protein
MYNRQTAFPGISAFQEGQSSIDPYQIPGVAESGWHPDLGQGQAQLNPLYPLVRQLLSDLQVFIFIIIIIIDL